MLSGEVTTVRKLYIQIGDTRSKRALVSEISVRVDLISSQNVDLNDP